MKDRELRRPGHRRQQWHRREALESRLSRNAARRHSPVVRNAPIPRRGRPEDRARWRQSHRAVRRASAGRPAAADHVLSGGAPEGLRSADQRLPNRQVAAAHLRGAQGPDQAGLRGAGAGPAARPAPAALEQPDRENLGKSRPFRPLLGM
eukprot:scaffold1295_cov220-Pinguiococcus_pyrenoidosus.AAC.6